MEKTLEEKIHAWSLLGNKDDAQNYYWSEIFPKICLRAKKNLVSSLKKYHCLISLVGFSPIPLILTIKVLEPEFIVFICTKETLLQLDVIAEKAGLKPSQFKYFQVSGSQSEDVYSTIKLVIAEQKEKNIAIDITGGKKPMVYNAAVIGAFKGCDLFYVDFSEYDLELRRPKYGSEYLNFLSNPFEVFGDIELEKGKRLFNEGNYYAASQIFMDLLEKLPRNDEAVFLHELSLMFKDWDEYNFPPALEACQKAIKQMKRCKIYIQSLDSLKEKETILLQLIAGDPLTITLNHYFTSNRMAERNRFDFAAFLLYRTLEMAFSVQLEKKYGFNVNEPNYNIFGNEEDVAEKYNQAGVSIHKKGYKPEPLPSRLSFMNAYQLLFALKDPMVQGQHSGKVKRTAQIRNKSILAHGTSCITEQEFHESHQCFLPFLDYFITEHFDGAKLGEFSDKFSFFKID